MSWDIFIQNLPEEARNVSDIGSDYKPGSLGAREALISLIHEALPDVDFENPSWGILHRPEFSIEFNMGENETRDGFALHVRGGVSAIATIEKLLQHLNLRAIDCQTSEFFSAETAQAGFDQWRAYRDRVAENYKPTYDHGRMGE